MKIVLTASLVVFLFYTGIAQIILAAAAMILLKLASIGYFG
jgi:hypothetical protein